MVLALVVPVSAQQAAVRRFVRASGEGTVTVRPDAARVGLSIVTQDATAAEVASKNSTAAAAVIAAIRQLLGPNADVKTVSYNLTPTYTYPRDGSPQQLTGFLATNSIEAVAGDITLAGRVIDTAVSAGATRVDGIRLFLKDDDASRAQALRTAAQRAKTRADAIALGLGVRLGGILSATEGVSTGLVIPDTRLGAGAAAQTPIEGGTLEVRAIVTVDVEITP